MGGSRNILDLKKDLSYKWDPHDATGGGNPIIKAMAYGSGVGALPAWEYDRGRRAGLSNSDQFSAVSTGGYTFNQSLEKSRARQEADRRRRGEDARQARIGSNLDQLDSLYGVGDSAEAKSNAAGINNWLDSYQHDVLDQSNHQLDSMKMDSALGDRQQLASQGLLGGTVDAQAQRKQLSDYVTGRQRAVASAGGARQDLETQLRNQRVGLERDISSGVNASPNWSDISAGQHTALDSASRNIIPTAIGDTLTNAGGAYQQNQVALGSGGRGFSWGGSGSRTSSRGAIT